MRKAEGGEEARMRRVDWAKMVDWLIGGLPLVTALPPVTLVFVKLQTQAFGFEWWQALLSAAALELMGAVTMALGQKLRKHNRVYEAERWQVPVWPTNFIFGIYLGLMLSIVVGVELGWPAAAVNGLLASLGLPGYWLMGLNYRVEAVVKQIEEEKEQRRRARAERKSSGAGAKERGVRGLGVREQTSKRSWVLACPVCKDWSTRPKETELLAQKALAGHLSWHDRNGGGDGRGDV